MNPAEGFGMDVSTLLAIGLGPSLLVMLAGIAIALARTAIGSTSQEPRPSRTARTQG
jgi:hypothetical protein